MDIQVIRKHLKNFELQPLFIHGLGWSHPRQTSGHQIRVALSAGQSQQQISFSYIAQIKQIPVIKIEESSQMSHFDTQNLKMILKHKRKIV